MSFCVSGLKFVYGSAVGFAMCLFFCIWVFPLFFLSGILNHDVTDSNRLLCLSIYYRGNLPTKINHYKYLHCTPNNQDIQGVWILGLKASAGLTFNWTIIAPCVLLVVCPGSVAETLPPKLTLLVLIQNGIQLLINTYTSLHHSHSKPVLYLQNIALSSSTFTRHKPLSGGLCLLFHRKGRWFTQGQLMTHYTYSHRKCITAVFYPSHGKWSILL